MSSISVRGLDLRFGEVPVLSDLDLEVREGEFLVLLGPSGCGKSTLLNCIAGLLDLSGGQVHIGGRNVTWAEPSERGIGMVFQSYALYPQMSVEKNLSFGLRVARMPKAEIAERVARAADVLQIEPLLKRKPRALSGGQRQRVAIGRALVRDVDVFLFDEPLSNLDAKLRTELRVELKRLHRRLGNTMLYVTHDQIEALTLADRIAIMKGGRIEQLDTPQGIYHRPVNRFVAGFIGSPGMNFLPGTLEERGGVPTFALAGGPGDDTSFSVPLDRYEFARAPAFGRPVELGIRPEHVSIEDARSLPASVQLSVDIVESMGADTILWSAVGGHVFTVRIDSEHSLDFGEGPVAGFDPARASLFDANGGERL